MFAQIQSILGTQTRVCKRSFFYSIFILLLMHLTLFDFHFVCYVSLAQRRRQGQCARIRPRQLADTAGNHLPGQSLLLKLICPSRYLLPNIHVIRSLCIMSLSHSHFIRLRWPPDIRQRHTAAHARCILFIYTGLFYCDV